MIREAEYEDLDSMLELYLHLHETSVPKHDDNLEKMWDKMILDENYHIIVNEIDGKIVSSCVCIILPNITRNVRSFALVEYVVTHADFRGKGYATECLNYAKEIAKREKCYKIMLMTGSKKPETLRFYENAGYSSADKTGFNQSLE
jgi:GNAT superfamily N-acetyltransferase